MPKISNSHVESVERELKFKGSILLQTKTVISKTPDLQVCVFIPYPYIFQPHSLVAQDMIKNSQLVSFLVILYCVISLNRLFSACTNTYLITLFHDNYTLSHLTSQIDNFRVC